MKKEALTMKMETKKVKNAKKRKSSLAAKLNEIFQ